MYEFKTSQLGDILTYATSMHANLYLLSTIGTNTVIIFTADITTKYVFMESTVANLVTKRNISTKQNPH